MIPTLLAALLLLDPRAIQLPAGETRLDRPLGIATGPGPVIVTGDPRGSTLVMNPGFQGSAAIVVDGASGVTLSGFTVRGNRMELKSDWYLPLREAAFADFYSDNGVVIRNSTHVTIRDLKFGSIRAFPVLIHASSDVTVEAVTIEDCGTLNRAGRNNTTGGILLEEGVSRFVVRKTTISRITGNAIWTHSWARSPRQADGSIRDNAIHIVGRDAIQVGHATRVRVENNEGGELGFPVDYVDIENHGVAVALDTAGNVDHAVYANNRFTEVNGQCIDLDGFHDGAVTGNSCINARPPEAYPASHYGIVFGNNDPAADSSRISVRRNTLRGFAYGAVFLVGSHNRVENNRFLDMNRARCGAVPLSALCNYAVTEQPGLLRSGIYLANNGGRPLPTRDNVIRGNVISGFGMKEHCIAAGPGVTLAANAVRENSCGNLEVLP